MEKAKEKKASINDSDLSALKNITKSMYESISYVPGGHPDIEGLKSLFSKGGRVITPELPDSPSEIFSIEDYIHLFEKNLEKSGSRDKGFYEYELNCKVDIFGNMAHILSTFETKWTPQDEKPRTRGVNSIQLLKKDDRWGICSITWDYERPDNPLAE